MSDQLTSGWTSAIGVGWLPRRLQKVMAMKKAAKTMKAQLVERDDKMKWRQEWQRLVLEEKQMHDELSTWMGEHRDITVPCPGQSAAASPRSSSETGLAEHHDTHTRTPSPSQPEQDAVTIGDLLAQLCENDYTTSLHRKTLNDQIGAVRRVLATVRRSQETLPNSSRGGKSRKDSIRRSALEAAQLALQCTAEHMSQLQDELTAELAEMEAADGGDARPPDGSDEPRQPNDEQAPIGDAADEPDAASPSNVADDLDPPSDTGAVCQAWDDDRAIAILDGHCATSGATGGGGALCSACPSPAVQADVIGGLVSMRRAFVSDMAALQAEWEELCQDCGVEGADDARAGDALTPRAATAASSLGPGRHSGTSGGWPEDAHLAYLQAVKMGYKAGVLRLQKVLRVDGYVDAEQNRQNADDDAADDIQSQRRDQPILATHLELAQGDLFDAMVTLVYQVTNGRVLLSKDQAELHHRWHQGRKSINGRSAARKAQWARELAEYFQHASRRLSDAFEAAEIDRRRAAANASHERVRRAAHARNEAAKARKAVEDAVASAISAELAEAEAAMRSVKDAKRKSRAEGMKAALARYREEQAAVDARMEEVRLQVEALEVEKRKESLATGAERVDFRRQVMAERLIRTKELAMQQADLEQQRAALLERLMAAVPYKERLDEIATTKDADRVSSHTASSQAATDLSLAYAAYLRAMQSSGDGTVRMNNLDLATDDAADAVLGTATPTAGDTNVSFNAAKRKTKENLLQLANTRIKEQGLFNRKGWTDKQVTSDKRFRLVSGIWAAGLQGTDAARTAVSSVQPTGRGSVALAKLAPTHQW